MNKIKRMVTAWVLMMSSIALLGAAGYIARADAGGETWFGGSGDGMGNAPRERRPAGNRPWGGNVAEGGEGEVKEQPKPIPEGESVWEDVPEDSLTNKPRLKSRPGNYGVLATLSDFIEGLHAVEFEYRDLCFPFRQDMVTTRQKEGEEPQSSAVTIVFASKDEFDRQIGRQQDSYRKTGKKTKNLQRKKNFFIEKLETRDLSADQLEIPDSSEFGLSERQINTFAEVRADHPEQCCMAKVTIREEHLDSDRTKSEVAFICLVRKAEGWQICWITSEE